ncbi:hypothetical protein V499_01691 [Pseudogymnoascus sp. VKM F-103]|uniref:NB-ARC domain-containing protein n=1 Tax=Pseudogymnoascus verrucosus TaxID=342668 RepID=A0A1B8GCN5_9PEZI|nr:uncharacterized protein VE01_08312 [Pseudogymnoascus verrucosus]KFY79311.1 hypothetical protein V499_01691 [Pseudogymnoascus sp. VKM F-103]OBT93583.1 hypothetical protein VE01_08312 [Pseudogymnoascus verrucosus]
MSQIHGHKSNSYDSIKLDGTSRLSIGDTFNNTVFQQPVAPLPVPKQHFNVLLPRAQHFVGRDGELAQLTKALESGKKAVVAGLGGVGKSQIALEYCYQYRKKYPISYVWWIDAVNTARIVQAYSDIAETLHLPVSSKENLMRDVRIWFSQPENGQWLFVFDNVNDPEAVLQRPIDGQTGSMLDYMPHNHLGGQIIITSITKEAAYIVNAELIEVDILPSSEARLLIRSYLPQPPDNSTSEDLDMLADTLSCIPLALTQASKYLRQMGKTVKEYLSMLKNGAQKSSLLSRHLGSHHQYHENQHTIFTVLNVSYTTLKHKHKLGFEMLNIACWLHRVNIPERILRQHCQGDKEMSEVEFDEAILPLMQYSFLEKQSRDSGSDEAVYCMHSLIQAVVQIFQSEEGLEDASKSNALMLIEQETIPLMYKHNWHALESWLPHIHSVIQCSNGSTLIQHQSRSPLHLLLGTYSFSVLSREDEAMEYLEASLPDLQRPVDISNGAVFLASCYEEKVNGKPKAIELLRLTLERPDICSAPMSLAIRLEARFRCKIAALLCELSPPQPKEAQDEVSKAAELLGRFEIVGHSYEQLIPYMITRCRGKIALVHAATSNSKEADELLRESEIEVLEYWKRLKDIKTPSNVDNNRKVGLLSLLGQVYMAQAARGQPQVKEQKLKDAELSFRTCYNFCRHDSGDLSTWALRALYELAECLREQKRYYDMEVLLKVLTSNSGIAEQGKTSAKFLKSVDLLSWVLMEQGKWQEALDVCENFYPAMEKVCGEGHRNTVDVRKRQVVLRVAIDRQREKMNWDKPNWDTMNWNKMKWFSSWM